MVDTRSCLDIPSLFSLPEGVICLRLPGVHTVAPDFGRYGARGQRPPWSLFSGTTWRGSASLATIPRCPVSGGTFHGQSLVGTPAFRRVPSSSGGRDRCGHKASSFPLDHVPGGGVGSGAHLQGVTARAAGVLTPPQRFARNPGGSPPAQLACGAVARPSLAPPPLAARPPTDSVGVRWRALCVPAHGGLEAARRPPTSPSGVAA